MEKLNHKLENFGNLEEAGESWKTKAPENRVAKFFIYPTTRTKKLEIIVRRFQNFPYTISVFIVWQITKCYIVKKSNFSDHWVGPRKDDARYESRRPASLAAGFQNFTIFPKFTAAGKIFQGAPVSPSRTLPHHRDRFYSF